jgi:hypothetical protein
MMSKDTIPGWWFKMRLVQFLAIVGAFVASIWMMLFIPREERGPWWSIVGGLVFLHFAMRWINGRELSKLGIDAEDRERLV